MMLWRLAVVGFTRLLPAGPKSLKLRWTNTDGFDHPPLVGATQTNVPRPVSVWRGHVCHETGTVAVRSASAIPQYMGVQNHHVDVALQVLAASLPPMNPWKSAGVNAPWAEAANRTYARRHKRGQGELAFTHADRPEGLAREAQPSLAEPVVDLHNERLVGRCRASHPNDDGLNPFKESRVVSRFGLRVLRHGVGLSGDLAIYPVSRDPQIAR